MAETTKVRNTKVVFKGFIEGAPKEEDMEVAVGAAALKIPAAAAAAAAASGGAVLVKNLYLSCDPYMRGRMRENYNSYIPPFQPGSGPVLQHQPPSSSAGVRGICRRPGHSGAEMSGRSSEPVTIELSP